MKAAKVGKPGKEKKTALQGRKEEMKEKEAEFQEEKEKEWREKREDVDKQWRVKGKNGRKGRGRKGSF